MNLSIGQTVTQLRKKCNITQEQLASNIGVSAQAVSKWETDASYPDISLLPVIAKFFGVTVDYLLEYNVSEGKKSIDETLTQIRKLNFDRKFQEAIKLIERVQTYPINFEIEYEKGCALMGISEGEGESKRKIYYLCEAKSGFEMIIKNCLNCKIVDEAKRSLAEVYNSLDEYDKAIEILSTINAHFDITGVLSRSYFLKGNYDSSIEILQEHLLHSLDGVWKACYVLCSMNNKMDEFDKALKYIELSSALLETANEQGETNFWDSTIEINFFWRTAPLIKADRIEAALKVIDERVDYVIRYDEQKHDKHSDVWYLNNLKPLELMDDRPRCEILLDHLKNHRIYDKLRDLPSFNELINRLEKELS